MSTRQYTVMTTIQSGDNPPVEVQWYKGNDGMLALSAMAQATAHNANDEESTLPESIRYRTLNVRVDISEVA